MSTEKGKAIFENVEGLISKIVNYVEDNCKQ